MGGLNTDWLSQLALAHAPAPPGWWPLAPGWWGLALLLGLIVAALVYWRSRPSSRLRRTALRELKQLEAGPNDDVRLAGELEQLMRRYAVAAYGRETAARLSGSTWLTFLAEHGGKELAGEEGQSLLRAAYGGPAPVDRARWLKGARGFIGSRR